MEKRSKKRFVSVWTIIAFLLCALLLVVFATKGVQRLLLSGVENGVVRMILDVVIYAVPTAAIIFLADKANKYDVIRKEQKEKEKNSGAGR